MANDFLGRTFIFTAPSGHFYEIREQNGEDEDILSNLRDIRTMTNFTKFITAIVVNTDLTVSGKLTNSDAETMPSLDRYCILLQSRIFSIGNILEFEYKWPTGETFNYEQDLNEMLFSNYGVLPSEEELEAKPNALPYYPLKNKFKDIEHTLASGKLIMFDLLNGKSESWLATLPDEKRSRNTELLAHNIRLKIDDKYERVENFKLFSVKDMMELRRVISDHDPEFTTGTEINNPVTGAVDMFPVMTSPNFFFPTER